MGCQKETVYLCSGSLPFVDLSFNNYWGGPIDQLKKLFPELEGILYPFEKSFVLENQTAENAILGVSQKGLDTLTYNLHNEIDLGAWSKTLPHVRNEQLVKEFCKHNLILDFDVYYTKEKTFKTVPREIKTEGALIIVIGFPDIKTRDETIQWYAREVQKYNKEIELFKEDIESLQSISALRE